MLDVGIIDVEMHRLLVNGRGIPIGEQVIPPPLLVIVSPVSVTTVQLDPAETSDQTIKIGMIQINRKNVVSRSSFSG